MSADVYAIFCDHVAIIASRAQGVYLSEPLSSDAQSASRWGLQELRICFLDGHLAGKGRQEVLELS